MSSPIQSILDNAVSSGKFLGIGFVAVKKNGHVIYSGAHGHRDFPRTQPMTLDTGGWMASMSKLMTSVAVMIAVEKGLVGLDDDVADILPELKNKEVLIEFDGSTQHGKTVPLTEKFTLRRLTSHSSGFAYISWTPTLERWAKANNKTFLPFVGDFERDWDFPPIYQPGTEWAYGTGLDWAGKVVEKVSGKTLEQFMRENIWDPLGMKNTTFHPEKREAFPMLALAKRTTPGGPLTPTEPVYAIPAQNESGGAGIFSTCEDYASLVASLLRNDSPILSEESINELLKPQLSEESKKSLSESRTKGLVLSEIPDSIPVDHAIAGLYLESEIPGGRSKASVTWDGMSSPQWFIDRSAGVALVLFVQILVADPETKRIWWELEQEVFKTISSK